MKAGKIGKGKDLPDVTPFTPKVEEVVPSLQNENFICALLATQDVFILPKQIASSLGLSDYHVNLQSSVLVDFHFNNLMFAAEHGFSARTTCVFLDEMEDFRQAIVRGESDECLSNTFKLKLMSHLKEPDTVIEKVIPPPQIEEIKPIPKKAPPKKGKAEPPPPPPEPEPMASPEFVLYSIGDICDITEYAMTYLMQHQKLFQFIFANGFRPVEQIACRSTFVEMAVPPLPLCKALPETIHLENIAKKLAEEHVAIAARAEIEEQKIDAAQKAVQANQDIEQRRMKNTTVDQAHVLNIGNGDVLTLIDGMNNDITSTIGNRQRQILTRIDALIEKFNTL